MNKLKKTKNKFKMNHVKKETKLLTIGSLDLNQNKLYKDKNALHSKINDQSRTLLQKRKKKKFQKGRKAKSEY